jgi:predicted ester cyclase
MYFKAFPDFHQAIEQTIASGDWVVSRWQATGTHKGEFNGIPPTNRKISVRGCTVSEIRNGCIVKTFISYDQLAILQQLGIAKVAGAGS